MKKGMILVAKKTVVMRGSNALTKGKEYKVKTVRKDMHDLSIIDDQKDEHWFDFDDVENFFATPQTDDFEEFFSFMVETHGLILTNGEMWDILHEIEKLQEKLKA